MKYIKNNKVFIFLFSILLLICATLSFQLLFPESNKKPSSPTATQSSTTKITNFSGAFNDDKLAVELSWNVSSGNKTISKMLLYCNDVEVEDVSNSYSVSLSEKEYGIITGNNKFDLIVNFNDGSQLTKTTYVYTDEAYAIKIAEQNMDIKSVYTMTYYYDKRRPVNVPSVQMSGITENFTMNYVSSETISEDGNIVHMRVVYELLYNNAKPGNYQVALTFAFSQYNLSQTYTGSFQVSTPSTIPSENMGNETNESQSNNTENGSQEGNEAQEDNNIGDEGNE